MIRLIRASFLSLRLPGEIKSLDGLRAIAILLVVCTHIFQRIPGLSFVYWNTEWAKPLYNGWIGVDLFFVLSGFLIGSAIIKSLEKNTFSLPTFYIQRSFRILPAYFFLILFIGSFENLCPHEASVLLPLINNRTILANLFLLTDYIPANLGIPSWSLSIEEHFYLLIPCFLIFFRKNETRTKGLLYLIFGALILRMITYRSYSISEAYPIEPLMKLIYFPFHNRMDALAIGVLISLINNQIIIKNKLLSIVSFYIGILLVGFIFISGSLQGGFFNTTIQYSLICIGFGTILLSALGNISESKFQNFLSGKYWVPIARISYSIYLTHLLIIAILNHFFIFKLWMFLPILCFCLLAAMPLYLIVEYPFHQFGKKKIKFSKNQFNLHPIPSQHD